MTRKFWIAFVCLAINALTGCGTNCAVGTYDAGNGQCLATTSYPSSIYPSTTYPTGYPTTGQCYNSATGQTYASVNGTCPYGGTISTLGSYGYGSTYCTLTASGGTAFAPDVPIMFYTTSTTGQQLEVISISPGTSWSGQPPYAATSPSFELAYLSPGTYTVSVVAQTITQPIQTCNAVTIVTIY